MSSGTSKGSALSAREKFYAYLVTDVTGTQVGKTEPGQHLLEREYKGNGSYTWTVYDFGKDDWPVTATITGVYVGIVYGENGTLTDESKLFLAGASASASEGGSVG